MIACNGGIGELISLPAPCWDPGIPEAGSALHLELGVRLARPAGVMLALSPRGPRTGSPRWPSSHVRQPGKVGLSLESLTLPPHPHTVHPGPWLSAKPH